MSRLINLQIPLFESIIIGMSLIENLIEYYDELFPVTEAQKEFYSSLIQAYTAPVKFLRVECGTGMFESYLAREGHDVTGIESYQEMLYSANLRRRNQLMSIRFFYMSYLDMTRFLGKGFYDVISCLDNRIVFLHDRTLIRKFFCDCRQLLAKDGGCVLSLLNYDVFSGSSRISLPVRESLRAKLFTELSIRDDGSASVTQSVETGTGRMLPVMEDSPVYLLRPAEIESFAREAGFASVTFYADFQKRPFTGSEEALVAVLR